MAIQVKRESLDTKARHVSPSYVDKDNVQQLVSSDNQLPVVSVSALRLQEGNSYSIGVVRDETDPLAADESLYIAIAFASGVTPTLNISGLCGGDAVGYLYEDATVTGGTSVPAFNMNRNIPSTSQSAILIDPTITNTGTLLMKELLLGGSGKKAGGTEFDTLSVVLRPLTTYLFRLVNINGTSHVAEIILNWYE